jgi:hypothetical protein
MTDERKHIVIVTRRFNEKKEGIGIDEESKKIKYFPHNITVEHNLFHFWAHKFTKNRKVSLTVQKTATLTIKELEDLFKKLDDKCPYRIEEYKYLLNVHELLHKEEDTNKEYPTRIFVYHHWLDKQGFSDAIIESDNNKHFLEYMREFIADVLKKRSENINDFTVNWLIHDSDILPKNYDGPLYYGGVIYSPNYIDMSVDEFKKAISFPRSLDKDNIWCFVHEKEISEFYNDCILNFNNNIYMHTPEQFHNHLSLDKKGCERRMEILELTDDNRELTREELLFILHKKTGRDFEKVETVKAFKKQLEKFNT